MIQTFVRGGQLPYGIRILANWHINNFINQRTQIGIFALRTSTFGRGYSRAISIKIIHLAAMINAAVFLLNVHLYITYCIFMVISLCRAKFLSVLFADAHLQKIPIWRGANVSYKKHTISNQNKITTKIYYGKCGKYKLELH